MVRTGYREVDLTRKLKKTDELFEESIDDAFCPYIACLLQESTLIDIRSGCFFDLSRCGQNRKKKFLVAWVAIHGFG